MYLHKDGNDCFENIAKSLLTAVLKIELSPDGDVWSHLYQLQTTRGRELTHLLFCILTLIHVLFSLRPRWPQSSHDQYFALTCMNYMYCTWSSISPKNKLYFMAGLCTLVYHNVRDKVQTQFLINSRSTNVRQHFYKQHMHLISHFTAELMFITYTLGGILLIWTSFNGTIIPQTFTFLHASQQPCFGLTVTALFLKYFTRIFLLHVFALP